MQIQFGETSLPAGTMLPMTTLIDGVVQHHRAETFEQLRATDDRIDYSLIPIGDGLALARIL